MTKHNDGTPHRTIEQIVDEISRTPFRRVEDGMTQEPDSGKAGLDDFENNDWRVRTLALRDLVAAGASDAAELVRHLSHTSPDVRYLLASALGVMEAEPALDALHKMVLEAPESTVRSQAAISLGQIGSNSSVSVLEKSTESDSHHDVVPQSAIALGQIRSHERDQSAMRAAVGALDESSFRSVDVGDRMHDFSLPTVDGETWQLSERVESGPVVLIFVFADWCPVCHHEFLDLIEHNADFQDLGVSVATVEGHDEYRCRVMAGVEPKPHYWYSDKIGELNYAERRWWPHLMDYGGNVGATLGVDPMTFAVHSEFINRPSTVVIGTDRRVLMAYRGTFWGDRPTIEQTVDLLRSESYEFSHPERVRRR